jgi:hypothetical protein
MDRLTFLPSTIERVGTEFVNPTGTFSNPIVISFTTHSRVLMYQHIQFTSMLAPTLPSIPPLYRVTFSRRHSAHFIPHVNDSPLTIGLWRTLPPLFFFFLSTTHYGPLRGVTSGFTANQWRFSITRFLFQTVRDFVLLDPLVSPPSRDLPRILVNCFLGCLRDSQSLVLGGNGFPPDPLPPRSSELPLSWHGHQC